MSVFSLEYAWMVELDVDGDGMHDLEVAATHFKEDREPRFADPISVLQSDLWRREGAAGSITGSASLALAGNTITLTTDDDEEPDLALIVGKAQAAYVTQFQVERPETCEDRLP